MKTHLFTLIAILSAATLQAASLQPVVTGISPSNALAAGGMTVTITGHGFTEATDAVVGGMPVMNLNVLDDETIVATTSADVSADLSDVIVKTPSGTAVASGLFSMEPIPQGFGSGTQIGWTGSQNNVWSTVNPGPLTNWTTGGTTNAGIVPSLTDDVYFSADVAQNFNTTLGSNFFIKGLYVFGPNLVSITGANTLTVGIDGVAIGNYGGGIETLTVTGAGTVVTSAGGTPNLVVGFGPGTRGALDTGTLNVTNGAVLNLTGTNNYAYIGGDGNGTGGVGTVTVSGAGSALNASGGYIYIGTGGTGTLNVLNGATVTSAHSQVGAFNQNGGTTTGTATVSGTGSTWTTNSGLDVGVDSGTTGTLNITNGGVATSQYGHIGEDTGSTGTVNVDGAGSSWTVKSNFYVSTGGTGTLNITNGGVVSDVTGNISNGAPYDSKQIKPQIVSRVTSGNGTVNVSGAGSQWNNSGSLIIADYGTGTLNITKGGLVTASYVAIGYESPGVGIVTVDGAGSQLKTSGQLYLGDGGTGTLNLQNGGLANVSNGGGYLYLGDIGSPGTLNIGAFGGGTTAGTVNAAKVIGAGSTAIINFNQTDTTTFLPLISGNVVVNQLGKGVTIIPTANSYSGGTNIYDGILITQSGGALGSGLVTLNGGDLRPQGVLSISALTWNGGHIGLQNPGIYGGAAGDILRIGGAFTNGGGGGTFGLGAVALGKTYSLLTYNGSTNFTLGNFTAVGINNSSVQYQGVFTLIPLGVDPLLNFTVTGATANLKGGVLSNDPPAGIPTFAAVTISGPVSTVPGETTTVESWTVASGGNLDIVKTSILNTTDPTVQSGGSLLVDGTLISAQSLNILHGGFLSGSGLIAANVFNSGIVSPGDGGLGKLTIQGDYHQSKNGTLVAGIASRKSFGQLAVSGHATLGGTLQIQALGNYVPQYGDSFKLLTASGGVSGHFSKIINPYTAAPGSLNYLGVDYTSKAVLLDSQQNTFANALSVFKLSANEVAVAGALDSALNDPRQAKVLAHFDTEAITKVPGELNQISPDQLTSIYTASFAQMESQVLSVEQRLADIRAGVPNQPTPAMPQPSAKGGKNVAPQMLAAPDDRYGFFITATGNFTTQHGSPGLNGYDIETGGTALGFDVRVNPNVTVGIMFGYDRSSTDLTGNGKLNIDGGRAALYGMYHRGGFYIESLLGGGYNSYDTKRAALLGTATGSSSGGEMDASVTFGYDAKFGKLTVTPLASMLYTLVGMQGYNESGSLVPLHIDSQDEASLRTRFGLRASYTTQVGAASVTPSFSAQWQHEFLSNQLGINSSFANGSGSDFTVNGPVTGRDSALVTAAVNIAWSRYAVYLAYQSELGQKNYSSQNVLAGFRVAW